MVNRESNLNEFSERTIARYHQVNKLVKELENELNELKNSIHAHFDLVCGKNEKGELQLGQFKIQRQIRRSESYHDEKMIPKLEELNLTDCIELVKKPDKQKIEAAVTLGLLKNEDIEECIVKRISQAIIVKETSNKS
ncbi:hypothetical protein ACFFIX_15860 [Metabacillus herbersteinensis]|uniref:Uncharacterized protein n=1 Tax=Metabacillus herbersteinensis TaxID=283816 RepID=A0ABV6GIG2_9BACI